MTFNLLREFTKVKSYGKLSMLKLKSLKFVSKSVFNDLVSQHSTIQSKVQILFLKLQDNL